MKKSEEAQEDAEINLLMIESGLTAPLQDRFLQLMRHQAAVMTEQEQMSKIVSKSELREKLNQLMKFVLTAVSSTSKTDGIPNSLSYYLKVIKKD